jgi:hypothetical protein
VPTKGAERVAPDRRAQLGEQDVAQARFRAGSVEHRLEELLRILDPPQDHPRGDHRGFVAGQELVERRAIDVQPRVKLPDALVGVFDPKSRFGHDLHRIAELGDDRVLAGVHTEKTELCSQHGEPHQCEKGNAPCAGASLFVLPHAGFYACRRSGRVCQPRSSLYSELHRPTAAGKRELAVVTRKWATGGDRLHGA